MNELTVTGRQKFMGLDIPIVLGGFGEGKKCISDKTIAKIHKQEEREIRRRITDNLKRFKSGVDFIDLIERVGESHTLDLLLNLGYVKLSERGYAKLIKIMDTDLAWEIHDMLMDEYFQMREEIQNIEGLSPLLKLMINTELEQKRQAKELEEIKEQSQKTEQRVVLQRPF